MATITMANAEKLVNSFENGNKHTSIEGTCGMRVSVFYNGRWVGIVKVSGMDFQVWDVVEVRINQGDLWIHGIGAPLHVHIRG